MGNGLGQGAHIDEKKAEGPMELEIQAVVSLHMWVLRTEWAPAPYKRNTCSYVLGHLPRL